MKFKKDILVKYLTYNYYYNTKFQEDKIKKVDVCISVSSIFFTLLNYKKNNIVQNLVYDNIYYSIEDLDNTIYNLNINKTYDGEKTRTNKEIKKTHIEKYLDFFFIELFGEYKKDKEKTMNYFFNFDKIKFKQYFKWDVIYTDGDKYNSSNKTSCSETEIEQKEQEIYELKDKLCLCEKETEKLKQQNLELQEKINEYEKQLEISNRFKESLKEYLK